MPPETNIETVVERAAASVLGAPARCVARLAHGEINQVFKVSARGRAFVLKVFVFKGWPEVGKLPWVEARLAGRAVPRARLLHYDRGAEFFPHGFSLSEHVEGANCKQAIRDGLLDPFKYLELAGSYLRAVHAIGPPRYGHLGDGRAASDDYADWVVGCELEDRARALSAAPGVGRDVCARAAARVEGVLRRFGGRFRPALVHADAAPKNALLAAAGRVVLVDWDEAFAAPWLWDYTHLSYCYAYFQQRDVAGVRAAFFRGHGPPEFDEGELDALEGALHTVEALDILAYHFKRGDAEGYAHARAVLAHLLDAPQT